MKLREWRLAEGLSQRGLALALGERYSVIVYQSHVACWERGSMPRKAWLIRLLDFTGGQVTANDFIHTNREEGAYP